MVHFLQVFVRKYQTYFILYWSKTLSVTKKLIMTIVSERWQEKIHNIFELKENIPTEKIQTYLKKEIQHFLQ